MISRSHLQDQCRCLAVAAQRSPVQHVAALHICVMWAAAKHQEQAHAVVEAFVRCPVQWCATIFVFSVEARMPAQREVKQCRCVAPLCSYVACLQNKSIDRLVQGQKLPMQAFNSSCAVSTAYAGQRTSCGCRYHHAQLRINCKVASGVAFMKVHRT